jgi:hypothetical protein
MLALLASTAIFAISLSTPAREWDLSLAAPVSVASVGRDDVVLQLTITNLSRKTGTLVLTNAICSFSLAVKDQDGSAVPSSNCTNIYNTSDRAVPPSGKVRIDLPLSQFVTIQKPGEYEVSVIGLLVRVHGTIETLPLTSNSVKLTFN